MFNCQQYSRYEFLLRVSLLRELKLLHNMRKNTKLFRKHLYRTTQSRGIKKSITANKYKLFLLILFNSINLDGLYGYRYPRFISFLESFNNWNGGVRQIVLTFDSLMNSSTSRGSHSTFIEPYICASSYTQSAVNKTLPRGDPILVFVSTTDIAPWGYSRLSMYLPRGTETVRMISLISLFACAAMITESSLMSLRCPLPSLT